MVYFGNTKIMRVTEEELLDIWYYFQYCCMPTIIMTRYAYLDYIDDIKAEKRFYRHETKQAINKVGKYLERLPNRLMGLDAQNLRHMNIVTDNMAEQFEDEVDELHKAIYLTFKNAKWKHTDCLTAIHFILAMLNISVVTFQQCCEDFKRFSHKDPTDAFHLYNLRELAEKWEAIASAAEIVFDGNKKAEDIDLNNLRCTKAINALRAKLADIDILRDALKKSYPYSPNYREDIPFENSVEYAVTHYKEPA